MKKLASRANGFTLIELIVALSILGMLIATASIGLPAQAKNARDARRKVDIEQIRSALALFYSERGYYPAYRLTASCNISPTNWKNALVNAGYFNSLEDIPKDPLDKSDYVYIAEPDRTTNCCRNIDNNFCISYTITATLERGGAYTLSPNDVAP